MRRSSAPTLYDVTREAGGSAMTVSVVINGTGSNTRASEDTRRMDTLGVVSIVESDVQKLDIPGDVSLAGFDDTLTARITLPQIPQNSRINNGSGNNGDDGRRTDAESLRQEEIPLYHRYYPGQPASDSARNTACAKRSVRYCSGGSIRPPR
jgi:hypothetical protein